MVKIICLKFQELDSVGIYYFNDVFWIGNSKIYIYQKHKTVSIIVMIDFHDGMVHQARHNNNFHQTNWLHGIQSIIKKF